MINNDVIRSIRHMLMVSDKRIMEMIQHTGYPIELPETVAYLKKEDEPGYLECGHRLMAHFLDGLIIEKRGRDENKPLPPIELPVTNNIILKKIRVAFELKDDDIVQILESVGFPISKTEISAFFRRPDHKNYRNCGDQFLRNFLKGLTNKIRPS